MTVSYISAETGRIVGDTNGNWVADANEPYFGRFQIIDAAVARGDLNGDDVLSAADIDLLAAALRDDDPGARFDMNGDATNNLADYDLVINSIIGVPRGDANLDGAFTSSDLVSIFQVGTYETAQPANWADGDWDGDGFFSSADLVLVFQLGTYRG